MSLTRRDAGGTVRPRRQWPLLLVAVGVLAGLVLTFLGPATWRAGSVVIGAAVVLGALLRLVLPTRDAGLLQVRSRGFDVAVMMLAGVAIIVLALAVPPGR